MPAHQESPLDASLARWVPRDVLTGRENLDPSQIVNPLPVEKLRRMVVDLENAIRDNTAPRDDGIFWDVPTLPEGQTAAYVASGSRIHERLIHAALYADHLFVSP